MQKIIVLGGLILLFFINTPAFASNLCSSQCSFNEFFKCSYENLTEYLAPNEEAKRIFDMLFNAYSIKFEGLDFEYKAKCEALSEAKNADETNSYCLNEQKKYIKNLAEIAQEEYENFLDDLNFEICGCENAESKVIKRHKKRCRKALKKLIARNCK